MNFLPTNYALKKRVAVLLFIVSIILLGSLAYRSLPKEWAPDIGIPILVVTTVYPSAAPIDIESQISYKLEKNLKSVDELKKITSTSAENVSVVVLEFNIDANLDEARNQVREALDKAKEELPQDAEDSIISDVNFAEFPIMTFNISGNLPLNSIYSVAKLMKEDLEALPGIIRADLIGGSEKELQVRVDPVKLQYYNLSVNDIVSTIQRENVNIPSGNLEIGPLKYSVRVPAEIKKATDIEDIIVKADKNSSVYIKDLAKVNFIEKELNSFSRVGNNDSISLSLVKKSGYTITLVAQDANKIIKEYKQLYPNLDFNILNDSSIEVEQNISDLENNIFTGVIFVVLVLLLVMGIRNALLVGFTIPLSMLLTFVILNLMSITLNFIVLFSLSLSLGMLVDNAVVIIENIYRHLETGKKKIDAIRQGVGEVAFPIISSTLTTLAAFLPLLFMPDIIGEFMRYIPIVLIVTLSSSLLVALILNPIICSFFISLPKKVVKKKDEFQHLQELPVLLVYQSILKWALKHRLITVIGIFASWFLVLFAFGASKLGAEFFPKDEPRQVTINVELPPSTKLEETNRVVEAVSVKINPFLKYTDAAVANAGFSGNNGETSNSGTDKGHILLVFPNWERWEKKPTKVINDIRGILKNISGAKVSVAQSSSGPPVGKAINIEIQGENLLTLKEIAKSIQSQIQSLEGIVNLQDNLSLNRPEIRIEIDRAKLAQYKISASQVAQIVRTALSGSKAGTYRIGKEEHDIVVRFDEDTRADLADLKNFNLVSPVGANLNLADVAVVERGPTFNSIRHIDEKRAITISADAANKSGANLLREVKTKLAGFELPSGYNLRYTGEDESSKRSQAFLIQSFFVAIFLIFIILVLQFNSLAHSFIILSSVVLSLMGVFGGLLIHQRPFSIILGGIGTVSLAGIVVNNSIVLLDYIEQLKARGFSINEAIIKGCITRFRPVMLTAATTVLGLMPIILGLDINFYNFPAIARFGSEGGTIWVPMAYAIVYGLIIATLLTLVITPVFYSLLCSAKNKKFTPIKFIISKLSFLKIIIKPLGFLKRIIKPLGFIKRIIKPLGFLKIIIKPLGFIKIPSKKKLLKKK